MHVPVLLQEVLELLDPRPGDFIIDGTVDGGGHAEAILRAIAPTGKFLGIDLDEAMLADCKARIAPRNGITLLVQNYANLPGILAREKLGKANGLLLDLGFSSEQLKRSGRGFSFSDESRDEPLLMTYDDSRTPVRETLRTISEKELAGVLQGLGGERYADRIARAIIERRRKRDGLVTSGDLVGTVRAALPKGYERGRIDPATRTFQALRIMANGELENLEKVLGSLENILAPGGRVAIISFHSLEDGIVKRSFRDMAKRSKLELLTKKPIVATREEIMKNPRSRSAKLRGGKLK
ncbi:MAG: 16S rRNA (cytosine(1402)-N(4))-methyltransferase RsmH [Minisyncoccia bacterium]|jgi:16S rRNA (cytosine1402-N4)-methyltransferase